VKFQSRQPSAYEKRSNILKPGKIRSEFLLHEVPGKRDIEELSPMSKVMIGAELLLTEVLPNARVRPGKSAARNCIV